MCNRHQKSQANSLPQFFSYIFYCFGCPTLSCSFNQSCPDKTFQKCCSPESKRHFGCCFALTFALSSKCCRFLMRHEPLPLDCQVGQICFPAFLQTLHHTGSHSCWKMPLVECESHYNLGKTQAWVIKNIPNATTQFW